MTDHNDNPAPDPILRMRFGAELNALRSGDTPPQREKIEAKPAANANVRSSVLPEAPA